MSGVYIRARPSAHQVTCDQDSTPTHALAFPRPETWHFIDYMCSSAMSSKIICNCLLAEFCSLVYQE
eukprot:579461-Amphidinium_carterae.1